MTLYETCAFCTMFSLENMGSFALSEGSPPSVCTLCRGMGAAPCVSACNLQHREEWVLPCRCARSDLYYPHPMVQDVLWWCLYKAENLFLGSRLRKAALQEVMRHVHYEVRTCAGSCPSPVRAFIVP